MSKQYLVTTPANPTYNGKTCGVQFQNGRAFVSEYTIDPFLKLDVDQVIEKMVKDFGYEVEQVGGAKVDLFTDEVEIAETKTASKKRLPTSA